MNFRQEVKDAKIPSPSRGPQRTAWNDAYKGLVTGKKEPDDALRDLDADIASHEESIKDLKDKGLFVPKQSESDLDSMKQLRDLIAEKYGLQEEQAGTPEPEAPKKRRRGGGGDLKNVDA